MLILTRKTSERIKIGDVTITVVQIGKRRVKIAIEAPPERTIVRLPPDIRFSSCTQQAIEDGIDDELY